MFELYFKVIQKDKKLYLFCNLKGDLKRLLRSGAIPLSAVDRVNIIHQASLAVSHLAACHLVHGDIAARNFLVGRNHTASSLRQVSHLTSTAGALELSAYIEGRDDVVVANAPTGLASLVQRPIHSDRPFLPSSP